ncbi:MAG: ECF transporter S component, partial [Candidatus Hodarchaeales archaeon]
METPMNLPEGKGKRYYFETADLVIIALFAALGGISSSFIGNIARVIFIPLGIPGSGQMASGLHIIWYVLIYFWVGKKIGAVFLAGILKGFVELFTGNSIGIMAILVSVG